MNTDTPKTPKTPMPAKPATTPTPDLAAIKARCDAASPAPWRQTQNGDSEDYPICLVDGKNTDLICGEGWRMCGGDIEFLINARQDIPALLQLVQSQAQRLKELHVHLGNMIDELKTTHRGEWPRDLLCNECDCNVSAGHIHAPNCKIGQANKCWETESDPSKGAVEG